MARRIITGVTGRLRIDGVEVGTVTSIDLASGSAHVEIDVEHSCSRVSVRGRQRGTVSVRRVGPGHDVFADWLIRETLRVRRVSHDVWDRLWARYERRGARPIRDTGFWVAPIPHAVPRATAAVFRMDDDSVYHVVWADLLGQAVGHLLRGEQIPTLMLALG